MLLSCLAACQDDTEGLGVLPEVSDDMYSIYIDEEDPNLVHFDFTADRLQPLWEVELKGGAKATSNDRNFTLTMSKGDYKGSLMVYGRSGRSPKHEFTFHVDAPDPAVRMLCGTDESKPKVWVWDIWGEYNNGGQQRIFGYLWGEDWRKDSYYNPLEDMQGGAMQGSMLDDKMSFLADGRFVLEANNTVWVDGDLTGVGGWGVERAGIAQWQPKGTEAWAFIDNGTKRYIRFSGGGFPSVVADPTGVDADYEIVEISEDHLRLRWWRGEGDGIEFNFVPEGYQGEDPTPPTPPEPVEIPEQEAVTPLDKTSAEYLKLTGYSWKVGSLLAYINADGSQTGFETPQFLIGDLLNFNTDGSVTFKLGDDNKVFDNENGTWDYTPQGTEGFILGKLADGSLAIQFTGGAFPIISPVAQYKDLTFEVLKLTDTDLQLAWAYKEYDASFKYFVINYSATAKEGGSEPPVVDDFAEIKAKLTAHAWKFGDSGTNFNELWGGDNASRDETMTFKPDGTLDIAGDGQAFDGTNGPFSYAENVGKMTWSVVKDGNGTVCIKFGGGGFPLSVGDPTQLDCTAEIVELTDDALRVQIPFPNGWAPYYCVVLEKADGTPPPGPTPDEYAEQKALLTAHAWKLAAAGPTATENWGSAGSEDELLTLLADGKMTITGDGKAESCSEGAFDYTSFSNMTWSYFEKDGKKYIKFGNNGFPCAIGMNDNLGGTWEIVEMTADSLTLIIDCGLDWLAQYYVILKTAE